jgi:GTP-binding protein EngB required for normal cell division
MKLTDFFLYLIVIAIVAWFYYDSKHKPDTQQDKMFKYLDSMNKRNKQLFNKVDSLQKVNLNIYKEYTKVNLKYDTVQIAIDTMPNIEGTKLLLSISRQLTAKGIE